MFRLRDDNSKNPSADKSLRVQAVQHIQTVQVVRSFEGSENDTNPEVLAQEIIEDLEAALEEFRKIAPIQAPMCFEKR